MMSAQARQVLAAARRTNLSFFVMKVFETLHPGEPPLRLAFYVLAMSHALQEVADGRKRRLVITVPPRHLKSITAAVALVAWMLGHDPTVKIMVASYSQDLARHHSNLTRTIMQSAWYKRDFPATLISERGNRALELETTAGGVRKAVSVGGSVTGFGADLIIIDDCMKAEEARSPTVRAETNVWLEQTLLTRLNDKATGRVVSIQQRLHEDDLPALLLTKDFEHLNLPAIAEKEERIAIGPDKYHTRKVGDLLDPERENARTLEQIRRDMGPAGFAAMYQQDPTSPEGNLIRIEWFGRYEVEPERHEFLKVCQSWDTGISDEPTADPSVCVTSGFHRKTRKWYILDVFRKRLAYPDLKRAVLGFRRRWEADIVVIERANSGISLWQDLKAEGPFQPLLIRPEGSKEERFVGCFGEIEAGNVLLPVQASWLDTFVAELKGFPSTTHDDQVDALSQFITWQKHNWRWVLTERDEKGRRRRRPRTRKRPW